MIHCDIRLCVGCRMCEVSCSSNHFGAVSPALSRIRVAKLDEIGIDMAVACFSCVERPCLECPTEALSVGAQGVVLLDQEMCSACGECVEDCPVGAVGFYNDLPLFCDLCGGAPTCVTVCPSAALSYHEDPKEVSLEAFMDSDGNPNQRRAHFAEVLAEPLRKEWSEGGRVDS